MPSKSSGLRVYSGSPWATAVAAMRASQVRAAASSNGTGPKSAST